MTRIVQPASTVQEITLKSLVILVIIALPDQMLRLSAPLVITNLISNRLHVLNAHQASIALILTVLMHPFQLCITHVLKVTTAPRELKYHLSVL